MPAAYLHCENPVYNALYTPGVFSDTEFRRPEISPAVYGTVNADGNRNK